MITKIVLSLDFLSLAYMIFPYCFPCWTCAQLMSMPCSLLCLFQIGSFLRHCWLPGGVNNVEKLALSLSIEIHEEIARAAAEQLCGTLRVCLLLKHITAPRSTNNIHQHRTTWALTQIHTSSQVADPCRSSFVTFAAATTPSRRSNILRVFLVFLCETPFVVDR